MTRNKSLQLLMIGAVVVGLTACPGSKKPEVPAQKDTVAATEAPSDEKKIQDFLHSLPSPLHVAKMFKKSGLKYISGVANPLDNASKYNSQVARALNLGVYSADLAYATLNNQNQVAINTFKACKTLADGLNMSSIFESTNLMGRFERNIGNADSLVLLMADLHMESEILLKETDRYDVVYTSFAGAWIESLYLATNLTYKSQNSEIAGRILQQTSALSKLIELLGQFQKDGNLEGVITGLNDIKAVMEKLTASGKPSTDAEYQKIYSTELYPKVEALRKKITTEF